MSLTGPLGVRLRLLSALRECCKPPLWGAAACRSLEGALEPQEAFASLSLAGPLGGALEPLCGLPHERPPTPLELYGPRARWSRRALRTRLLLALPGLVGKAASAADKARREVVVPRTPLASAPLALFRGAAAAWSASRSGMLLCLGRLPVRSSPC